METIRVGFCRGHCRHFDADEEDKLIYMQLFKQHQTLEGPRGEVLLFRGGRSSTEGWWCVREGGSTPTHTLTHPHARLECPALHRPARPRRGVLLSQKGTPFLASTGCC